MNDLNSDRTNRVAWWESALMIRGQTEAEQRNLRKSMIWSISLGVGFCSLTYVSRNYPQLNVAYVTALAAIAAISLIGCVYAGFRFIAESDEFMRKVQLEGIAVGFGAGVIFCMGYFILELLGAPQLPLIAMALPLMTGWAIGSLNAAARYR